MLDEMATIWYSNDSINLDLESAQNRADELESKGVFVWLKTIFPFAFTEEFSADHIKFWKLYWSVLMRLREQIRLRAAGLAPNNYTERAEFYKERGCYISTDEWVFLLILGRALGKSQTIEASAVMRGAILNGGYCLYISEGQDQANEHIENCRILIDSDESRITEFYPLMRIDAGNQTVFGMKTKDAADIFITLNGWICRAKGLDANLRGLRKGGRRPDDICVDDIDGVNDSIAVSLKKLRQLTASVIPTQAKGITTIKFGQNLISETSVMNMIHTGKSGALAARTTIGVSNAFEEFEEYKHYESYVDEKENRIRWRILPAAVPTWRGVDVPDAQKFLDDSSIETFLAEYQNNFEHLKTEKVVHEYNERRHIITWDDFEKLFGVRYIPQHWRAACGIDIGFSENSLTAWAFVATSAQNSPLPARYFLYRGLTSEKQGIDNQAFKVWQSLFPQPEIGKRHFEANQNFRKYPELERLLKTVPKCRNILENYDYNPLTDRFDTKDEISEASDELGKYYIKLASKTFRSQIVTWRMSHEKTGEQITLAQKYGLPIQKTKHFGKEAGITELNTLLKGDYTVPHPFLKDKKVMDESGDPTGFYELGSPYLFLVVDTLQKDAPRDDAGLKNFREHLFGQRWTVEKFGEHGFTRRVPMKFLSDCLIAGTLVKTSEGDKPIEKVKVGDLILTRKGYRKCIRSFLSEKNAEIYRLTAEDGTEIEGTGNHPVFVEGKGFIDLRLIKDTDRIVKCELKEQISKEKLSNLAAFLFIVTRLPGICTFGGIIRDTLTGARLLCTLLFGSLLMEEFRMAAKFTTATTTHLTTTFPILSAYLRSNTGNITATRRKLKRTLALFNHLPSKRRKFGIAAKSVVRGIQSMRVYQFASLFTEQIIVNFAEKGLKRILQNPRNTVQIAASKNFSTIKRKTQPLKVKSVTKLDTRKDVYNLTVEDVHEFFANGILVHNCGDSLRMIFAEYKTAFSTPLTEEEKIEEKLPPKLRKESIKQDAGHEPEAEMNARRVARDIKLNFENPLKEGKLDEKKKNDFWGNKFSD